MPQILAVVLVDQVIFNALPLEIIVPVADQIAQNAVTAAAEITEQLLKSVDVPQVLPDAVEHRSAILRRREMPCLLREHSTRRLQVCVVHVLQQAVEIIHIVQLLLPAGIQDADNVLPTRKRIREKPPHTAAPLRLLVRRYDLLHSLQSVRIKLRFPIRILREEKQRRIVSGFRLNHHGVLLQLLRVIRQLFEVGADLAPIHGGEIGFQPRLLRGLIPLPVIIIAGNRLVPEKHIPDGGLVSEVCAEIRLDAAFGRVDLQPGQNGERFRLLPVALLRLR